MDEVKASDISDFLNLELFGRDIVINKQGTMEEFYDNALIFAKIYDEKFLEKVDECNILVIACAEYQYKLNCSYIISNNPRLDYVRVISEFFGEKPGAATIHPTAVIEPGAIIGEGTTIGAHCYIGQGVQIGSGSDIHHQVTIVGKVHVGKNCIIQSGAVIGEAGFGFERDCNGVPVFFPHHGDIYIGDNCFIGSNSTIARATIASTRIEDNCKIDNLVQLAHNCRVGQGTMIASNCVICGSVVIGKNCWISPNVSIREKLLVHDNAFVGMGAVVVKNVQQNSIVMGVPAKPL